MDIAGRGACGQLLKATPKITLSCMDNLSIDSSDNLLSGMMKGLGGYLE